MQGSQALSRTSCCLTLWLPYSIRIRSCCPQVRHWVWVGPPQPLETPSFRAYGCIPCTPFPSPPHRPSPPAPHTLRYLYLLPRALLFTWHSQCRSRPDLLTERHSHPAPRESRQGLSPAHFSGLPSVSFIPPWEPLTKLCSLQVTPCGPHLSFLTPRSAPGAHTLSHILGGRWSPRYQRAA